MLPRDFFNQAQQALTYAVDNDELLEAAFEKRGPGEAGF